MGNIDLIELETDQEEVPIYDPPYLLDYNRWLRDWSREIADTQPCD